MLRKGARSLIIVIVLALLAGFLAMGVISKARHTAPCLVASKALQAGTRLDEKAVEVKEIPAAAILPGAFTSLEEVEGQIITIPRTPGDQITQEMVGSKATASVVASLKPDHRAVAVHINRATGLAGMIQVGSQVTAVGIIDPQKLDLGRPTSTTESSPSAMAMVMVPSLRVLMVPETFRYREVLPGEQGSTFAPATTSAREQEEGVVLLDVPLAPIPLTPEGPMVSPVELLALLNSHGEIHLVGEPDGADYTIPPAGVSLYEIYQAILNAPEIEVRVAPSSPVLRTGPAEPEAIPVEEPTAAPSPDEGATEPAAEPEGSQSSEQSPSTGSGQGPSTGSGQGGGS
jgi:Flp pilus assembly protein CpaB